MKKQEAECPKEKEANKTFKPKSEPLIQEKEKLQRNTLKLTIREWGSKISDVFLRINL